MTEPVMPISHDRIYPRCVYCRGENWAMAVMAYSAGDIPCAAAGGCSQYLPIEYRRKRTKRELAALAS